MAWRCEIDVTEADIQAWRQESQPTEMAFVLSAAKRQRAEVKLAQLNAEERSQFQKAKETEIQNWINTELSPVF